MEFNILNSNRIPIKVLDVFESAIWTERYCGYGDFEIVTSPTAENFYYLNNDYYLQYKDSTNLMIIENLSIESNVESGNKFIVTGRSLESILERRVVWNQTILTGNFQLGIERLLNENAINPADPARKISNLSMLLSTDPKITSLELVNTESQLMGQTLYKAILDLCQPANIGFVIEVQPDLTFRFMLYAGTDRSYDQNTYPYVVFSPKFDNLVSGLYKESIEKLKTISLIVGEGEGAARLRTEIGTAGLELARREMYTDGSSLSKTIDGGTLSDAEYIKQLKQKGTEELAKNVLVKTFEGEIQTSFSDQNSRNYWDYCFTGDIVQVENEYGQAGKSRITELIRSEDSSGMRIYHTFTPILE